MIEKLRALTGIPDLTYREKVQSLWSGYGEIARYFSPSQNSSWVVKQVTPPKEMNHPRGWNSDLSHQRKLQSYEVETHFYSHYASACSSICRVPKALLTHGDQKQFLLVLEDIDDAGFPLRFKQVNLQQLHDGLRWLANFHAQFINHPGNGLWSTGTYWHLATRPEELTRMTELNLKLQAGEIDRQLNAAKYKTLVHGDAKLANFCFPPSSGKVAAVDFQYAGKGVGTKDVMLFLGSCLNEEQLFQHHDDLVEYYFSMLGISLQTSLYKEDINNIIDEWRSLLPCAWADFHRFLAGWSPGHVKINGFMQLQTRKVLDQLV